MANTLYIPGQPSFDPELTDLSAVSWARDRVDLFMRGADRSIHHAWLDASGWNGWDSLGGAFLSGPAVCSWGPGRLDVFGRGTDNALWHTWYDGAWHPWESLGGQITAEPAAVSWGSGRIDVFARGTNGACFHIWYDGQWRSWESLGGQLIGGMAACSWGPSRLDVFGRGTDNALWHKWFDGNSWSTNPAREGWESLGGTLISKPDAVSRAQGRIAVFARGTDNTCQHIRYFEQWYGWESHGGSFATGAAVSSDGAERLRLFARNAGEAKISTLTYGVESAGWSAWQQLSPQPPAPAESVTVNGMTVSMDQVARFAPIMIYHHEDQYLPCSIEHLLVGASLVSGWDDKGELGGWRIQSLAFDNQGTMWCVGTQKNVGRWNDSGWENKGELGGWQLLSLAFDNQGAMWCVGAQKNVGKWNGSGWENKGELGGWQLLSLSFDAQGRMWCVGNQNNVGLWSGSGWENKGELGGWQLLTLAFDKQGAMWCVGKDNNVGRWNGTGWENKGQLGGWQLLTLVFDKQGAMWCVGAQFNVGTNVRGFPPTRTNVTQADLAAHGMPGDFLALSSSQFPGQPLRQVADIGCRYSRYTQINKGELGGWQIRNLAFDKQGTMWCVGRQGNVGRWNGSAWENKGEMGGWQLLSLAFDNQGAMWCVGAQKNVGKWNGTGWENKGELGGWQLLSLSFDAQDRMWCVGNQNNVGLWNGSGWENKGELGGWQLLGLAFDKQGTMWCVGKQNNVGRWNGSGWDELGELGGWQLLNLAFSPAGTIWCVGTQFNVGTAVASFIDAPMYVSVQVPSDKSYVDLTFFFLSAYNGAQCLRVAWTTDFNCTVPHLAEHQGDVESISVRVRPDFSAVIGIRLEAHGNETFYVASAFDYQGTNPLVVSALSSHATYNRKGRWRNEWITLESHAGTRVVDMVDILGNVWIPFGSDASGRPVPDGRLRFVGLDGNGNPIGQQVWAKYAGRLGLVNQRNELVTPQAIDGNLDASQVVAAKSAAGIALAFKPEKAFADGPKGLGDRDKYLKPTPSTWPALST